MILLTNEYCFSFYISLERGEETLISQTISIIIPIHFLLGYEQMEQILERITEDVRNDRPIGPPSVYANTVIVSPRITRRALSTLPRAVRALPLRSSRLEARMNLGTELQTFSPRPLDDPEDEDEWPLPPPPLMIEDDPPRSQRQRSARGSHYTSKDFALVRP